jgi:DNA-binding CsgD family transcriptional regulator
MNGGCIMNVPKSLNTRRLSVAGFSFIFSYLMAFLFEGRVLYSLLEYNQVDTFPYVLCAIAAHFLGLLVSGFFIKTPQSARYAMILGMGVCILFTIPFFFPLTGLWFISLIVSGLFSGYALAAWGYFLKAFTPRSERIKTCADALIGSNILMIIINIICAWSSPFVGLVCLILCVFFGMLLIFLLQIPQVTSPCNNSNSNLQVNIKKPLSLLFLFITIITINSGLMYQVINPAFSNLEWLVSWYWAVPYILALLAMRNLPNRLKHSAALYVGMAMIMGAFISFMLLGRNTTDYLVVDTLMLGACGIFDLFWWSILADMLEYTHNPAKVLGIGLSANVLGVLFGDAIGIGIATTEISRAEVTIISLVVIIITLSLLPPLNGRLSLLLKNHIYLAVYSKMNEQLQKTVVSDVETLDPLTKRESEVLDQLLSGKSNKEIAEALFISESTVKTHARSIYSKYDVSSRAELISTLLKNRI